MSTPSRASPTGSPTPLYGYVAAGAVDAGRHSLFALATGGGIEVDRHSLLPIDFGRFARPPRHEAPLITLAPELLLERLAAEYVYAQLCEAAMHAFEAENEARMMAMAGGKNQYRDKACGAVASANVQLRQEEITTEMVELAAGAEASKSARR